MGDNFEHIKEIISNILNEEDTLLFINNITKPKGDKSKSGMIISKQDGINCFLNNIFNIDERNDISLEDNITNNCIYNLIVKGKRILVRSIGNKSSEFCFSYFKNNESLNKILEEVKLKKKIFDYVLIILIDRNLPNELFKVSYNFYLKPIKDFSLNNNEKTNWKLRSNSFCFIINKTNLGEPIFTYSYNYE